LDFKKSGIFPFGQVEFPAGSVYWMPLYWGWEWLALFWVVSGIILSLILAFSLKGKCESQFAWTVSATILILQFASPIMFAQLHAWGTNPLEYCISFPISSIICVFGIKDVFKSRLRGVAKLPIFVSLATLSLPASIVRIRTEIMYTNIYRDYLFLVLDKQTYQGLELVYWNIGNLAWIQISIFWLISGIILGLITLNYEIKRISKFYFGVVVCILLILQIALPIMIVYSSIPIHSNDHIISVYPLPVPSLLALIGVMVGVLLTAEYLNRYRRVMH
jgi:hypothetical protein